MWISLFFTITIIVISYFTGLYFGTEYQKIIDREKIKLIEQKHKDTLQNKKRQQIANPRKVWYEYWEYYGNVVWRCENG